MSTAMITTTTTDDHKGSDLIGVREFAEILGVKPKTVYNYNSRAKTLDYPKGPDRFPRPQIRTTPGVLIEHPVWRRSQAERFAQNRPGPSEYWVNRKAEAAAAEAAAGRGV